MHLIQGGDDERWHVLCALCLVDDMAETLLSFCKCILAITACCNLVRVLNKHPLGIAPECAKPEREEGGCVRA